VFFRRRRRRLQMRCQAPTCETRRFARLRNGRPAARGYARDCPFSRSADRSLSAGGLLGPGHHSVQPLGGCPLTFRSYQNVEPTGRHLQVSSRERSLRLIRTERSQTSSASNGSASQHRTLTPERFGRTAGRRRRLPTSSEV